MKWWELHRPYSGAVGGPTPCAAPGPRLRVRPAMECSLVAQFAGVFFTKFYGNSMEIYESRRVPWHFHRFPYVFQTLRENMWECHGLFLLSKSREKRGGSEATNMLGRHQKLWHWWSWDAMSPRMQLWKVSGSHGVSPSYWLLPPNYVALSIPKNKNSKARWSNSMCSTFVHEIEQVE